jgi:5-methylcytosine-specific restriction enzyme subunit McrC
VNEVITVREYARLTTGSVEPGLDAAAVSPRDFDWLCQLNAKFKKNGAPLLQVEGRQWLRLDNYVGIAEMPSGACLEILPKHHAEAGSMAECRKLLCKMIARATDLPTRDTGPADIAVFTSPLHEWVSRNFLRDANELVSRGLRFDYSKIDEEQRFLRGQLDCGRQMRQPPGRAHYFQIRHDTFTPDRPENRLLMSSLRLVASRTRDPGNIKLALELLRQLSEIPPSANTREDFSRWSDDRLMAAYRPIKKWCQLILGEKMPLAVHGGWKGLSLLFPMEKLFERYVAAILRKRLPPKISMRSPARSAYLSDHKGSGFMQLEPDILLESPAAKWILDTKWKLVRNSEKPEEYGLQQSDFYQLFAYGQKYLGGRGKMALVYPKTSQFERPLDPFHFSPALALHALPFDLADDKLLLPDEAFFS